MLPLAIPRRQIRRISGLIQENTGYPDDCPINQCSGDQGGRPSDNIPRLQTRRISSLIQENTGYPDDCPLNQCSGDQGGRPSDEIPRLQSRRISGQIQENTGYPVMVQYINVQETKVADHLMRYLAVRLAGYPVRYRKLPDVRLIVQ